MERSATIATWEAIMPLLQLEKGSTAQVENILWVRLSPDNGMKMNYSAVLESAVIPVSGEKRREVAKP
jgi:hypothetical protein